MIKSFNKDNISNNLFRMPRLAPSLISVLILGLLLLFMKELGQNIKTFLIPSLVIYAIGTALIGMYHRLLGLHFVKEGDINNEKPIPILWKLVIFGIHLIWFSSFLFYNFFRCVL